MAISLRALLEYPGLQLRPLTAHSPADDITITWGAVTELLNPAEFLTGQEIVLTTGIRQKTTASQRQFVKVLAENDVVALGFGTGLGHKNVPQTTLKAAEEYGLPVFEVPYQTAFATITKTIAEELNKSHLQNLHSLLRSHQRLTQSLLSSNLQSMLRELAKLLGTEVALSQYGARLYGPDQGNVRWSELPIATGMRDKCTLHLAEPYEHDALIEYAQSLIGLEMANKARLRESQRLANGQVLADLASGSLEGTEATARLRALGLNTPRNHVVILVQAPNHAALLHSLPLPPELAEEVSAVVEHRLAIVVPSARAQEAVVVLDEYLQTTGLETRIGYGGSYANSSGVRWSYFEALEALRYGERLNAPTKLSLTSLLLAANDVPIQDLAQEALGPIQNFDQSNKGELLKTLREYFRLDGSVGAVAESLGLHRNTVRYRIQQITELSGYDPSVTGDRVQLWIALSALELA